MNVRLYAVNDLAYNNSMQPATVQHIEMRPSAIHGLKACIVGTRISVEDIYVWHELMGKSPDQIVTEYPFLSLAQVHTALAYYYDHADEFRAQARIGRVESERIKSANPPKLAAKIASLGADGHPVPS
jgi:uncharacterized protein (DUF433 family)